MKWNENLVKERLGFSEWVSTKSFACAVYIYQCSVQYFLRCGLEANLCPLENICPEHRILCQTQFIEDDISFWSKIEYFGSKLLL